MTEYIILFIEKWILKNEPQTFLWKSSGFRKCAIRFFRLIFRWTKWFIQSILYWIRWCTDSLFETHKHNFFPRLCYSCWAHPPLQPCNRECPDMDRGGGGNRVRLLAAQIIEGNHFMEAVSLPRAWWHSPCVVPFSLHKIPNVEE